MTTEKEKAEAYVRTQIPELMELSFGCEFLAERYGAAKRYMCIYADQYQATFIDKGQRRQLGRKHIKQIIGHTVQLQHWLRVLAKYLSHYDVWMTAEGDLRIHQSGQTAEEDKVIAFDEKGQPATEADFKSFNQIVGI